jgi:hypothetical protein
MFDVKPRVPRPALGETARGEIEALRARLIRHVEVLGGEIGERNLFKPEALEKAAGYISHVWSGQQRPVTRESFDVRGRRCDNLFVEQKGSGRPEEIVLVGAHYDSVFGSPGANDNASGVAILLECREV